MRKSSFNDRLSYCGHLVSGCDRDKFMISMFLPAGMREDVWAVLAFNCEIAKIRETVSRPDLGLIRLQWWRDAIGSIYEGKGRFSDNEILKQLSGTIEKHKLPRDKFEKLLDARELDLEDVIPSNIEGLMNYAEFTTQPLYELVIMVMGADPSLEIMQPVAVNYALAGILRSSLWFAGQGRFYFPKDLMGIYSITKDNFLRQSSRDNVKSMVKNIVDVRLAPVKPDNVFLKASEGLSEMYFRHIISLDYDVTSPLIAREPFLKVLRVFMKTKMM